MSAIDDMRQRLLDTGYCSLCGESGPTEEQIERLSAQNKAYREALEKIQKEGESTNEHGSEIDFDLARKHDEFITEITLTAEKALTTKGEEDE